MENIIKKISNIISLTVVFFMSAFFYFTMKGFVYENGTLVLKKQVAEASTLKNGIATVLPRDISINVSQKFAVGPINAPLTLYEYSSLSCPHCADFHTEVLPQLLEDYVAKGLLRVIFVNFPLDKKSMKAGMIAECMTYDNYGAFITKLFNKQRFWVLDSDDEALISFATDFGLSFDEAQACMSDDSVAKEIIADRQQGITQLKLEGTPAFLFAGADGNEIIYGVPRYSDLQAYLDKRLQYVK